MALSGCRECGQQVSTEAVTCPHCGVATPTLPAASLQAARPVTVGGSRSRGGAFVLVVLLIALAAIFSGPILHAMGRSTLTGGKTDAVVGVVAPEGVCWTANIGGATQEGCGTKPFPVHDSLGLFSSSVQKKTADPVAVSIRIEIDGQVQAENTTSAAYGVATAIVGR